jgi:hypothetical protein
MTQQASEVTGVGDFVRQSVENGLGGNSQPRRIGSGVQKPQKPLAKPIIPTFRSAARNQIRVLQVLKKAMRRSNRQIAAFSDLGNTPSIYRCSDALQSAEVAFQRGVAFADQSGLLQRAFNGVIDKAGT